MARQGGVKALCWCATLQAGEGHKKPRRHPSQHPAHLTAQPEARVGTLAVAAVAGS